MQLLGAYQSKLQSFHYDELLQLYKQAIVGGDFSANATFDEATVNTLVQQSKDFSTLPLASAGQVVTDDSLNYPLSLLSARYSSLTSEANDFDANAAGLIAVLKKDTALLDQLLAAAGLNSWIAEQPKLYPSTKFSWDFGEGNGPTSIQITKQDPANGVTYPGDCPTDVYLDLLDGSKFTGLVAPDTRITIDAKNMKWSWTPATSGEQSEDIYGDGWAELSLLEDEPLLNFPITPSTQVILPNAGSIGGIFNVAGTVKGGSIPIYVRIIFNPRRNTVQITPQNAISDASFEAGGAGWSLGDGWTVQTDAGAHTGSKDAQKVPLTPWSSLTSYIIGDAATYLNIEYVCIYPNTDQPPNLDTTATYWQRTGYLDSPEFPLNPRNKVYIEGWVKNLAADGIVNISLVCLDTLGNVLQPEIYVPGVTSADNWLQFSDVLTAVSDSNVVAGKLRVSIYGQSTGTWVVDDFRAHLPQSVSTYSVNQDEVAVYTLKPNTDQPLTVFFQNESFVVDDISNVTFMGMPDGTPFTVRFTENFPGYQCSVNETVWSPLTMLDPDRVYPDDATLFEPVLIGVDGLGNRTLFPVTDETGEPTGLTLQMVGRPLYEYYFLVTTPASQQYGATAVLEIDLAKPSFMNGLTLAPFSTYPIKLVKVETESFTVDTRQTVGAPNVLLDRPMVLTFPTTLLRKVYLTCYQENYTLAEHVVDPPDALRRDTLFAIQTVLPFNVRRPQRAVPVYYRGAQYVFGLEGITGINTTPVLPGVFIAGPHHFKGCPEAYRFDASYFDIGSTPNLDIYLCWKAYNASSLVLDEELVGFQILPDSSGVWPFPNLSLLDRSQVDHVDIFLKFVIRDPEDVVQRYLLQVSSV